MGGTQDTGLNRKNDGNTCKIFSKMYSTFIYTFSMVSREVGHAYTDLILATTIIPPAKN